MITKMKAAMCGFWVTLLLSLFFIDPRQEGADDGCELAEYKEMKKAG